MNKIPRHVEIDLGGMRSINAYEDGEIELIERFHVHEDKLMHFTQEQARKLLDELNRILPDPEIFVFNSTVQIDLPEVADDDFEDLDISFTQEDFDDLPKM